MFSRILEKISGIRTGGKTAPKNSKYIAVVVDSILCCHTAQARHSSQQDLLPQQTNIHLSVSSFGLLLLFPKNLASLRSFFLGVPKKRYALWGIFSGALLSSTFDLNRQRSICPFRLLVYCSSFPKTLLLFVHSGFREPCF